jgi:hypothetical protein
MAKNHEMTIDKRDEIRQRCILRISELLRDILVAPGKIREWDKKELFTYCSDYDQSQCSVSKGMCGWFNGSCRVVIEPGSYWKYISKLVNELTTNMNKSREIMQGYRKSLDIPEKEVLFQNREDIESYLSKYDYQLENKKYIKDHPIEHYNYEKPYLTYEGTTKSKRGNNVNTTAAITKANTKANSATTVVASNTTEVETAAKPKKLKFKIIE